MSIPLPLYASTSSSACSPPIRRYFAECQRKHQPLCDYDGFCLIKTKKVIVKGNDDKQLEKGLHYYINGGYQEIHRLMEIDSAFLNQIVVFGQSDFPVGKQNFYKILEIHYCADLTCDLFKIQAIQKGHINTNGLHAYAYGLLNDKPFQGSLDRATIRKF